MKFRVKMLLKILGIKLEYKRINQFTRCRWQSEKRIIINTIRHIEDIDILHEIGHIFNGYGCCREHDEFRAHGVTTFLAKILRIDMGDMEERMDRYARMEDYICWRDKTKIKKIKVKV